MNKILLAALVMLSLILGGTAWLASRAISWARDLPNRISFEIDGESVGSVVTETMRLGLQAEDVKMQLEMIRMMSEMTEQHPETVSWVSMEFVDELNSLAQSPNTEVAAEASELLERIDAE